MEVSLTDFQVSPDLKEDRSVLIYRFAGQIRSVDLNHCQVICFFLTFYNVHHS